MEIRNFLPQNTDKLKNSQLNGLDTWVGKKFTRPAEYQARAMIRKALLEDNQKTDNSEIRMKTSRTWNFIEENQKKLFNGAITTKEGITIIPEKNGEDWQIIESEKGKIKTKAKISAGGRSKLSLNQGEIEINESSDYPRATLQVFDLLFNVYQNNRVIEP